MVNIKNIKINRLLKNKITYLVVFVLISTLVFFLVFSSNKNTSETIPEIPKPLENINLNPPTEEEKQQAIDNKSKIDENEEKIKQNFENTTNNKKIVKPLITFSGQYSDKIEVGSYIPEIFEDGGTCTAVFTINTSVISKQVNSVKEGRSTFCPLFSVESSEFSEKGIWNVIVKYESKLYFGESETTQMEIR